jgi:hypothetical protein
MTQFWGLTSAASFFVLVALPHEANADPPAENPPPAETSMPASTQAPPNLPADLAPAETPSVDKPASNQTPEPEKAAVAAPIAVALPKKGLPRLHIDANWPGVRLLRINQVMSDDMGEGMLVSNVCTAPCDQIIDARNRRTVFFFGADGMVPSRGFHLSSFEGDVVARVHGGRFVARQMGFLLGAFGGVGVIGGIAMLGFGYRTDATHVSDEGKIVEGPNPNLATGGFVALGVGAAMVTTAIVLVATAKTKFTLVQANDKSALVTWEAGTIRF